MNSAYITTYLNREILETIKHKDDIYINIFIDVRSLVPAFFNENVLKLVINDQESMELYVRKSIFNFFKYLDYHYHLCLEQFHLTPRFFFFSDSGESLFHKNIDKEYKANRKHSFIVLTEEEYYRSKQLVNGLLQTLANAFSFIPGVFYIHLNYLETDFIPYYILMNFNFDPNYELFIIKSRDKDLGQCLAIYPEKTFQVFRDSKRGLIALNHKQVITFHFLKTLDESKQPSQLVPLYLSIAGDSSDNVIGVKGIGYRKLYSLIEEANDCNWSLDNFENLQMLLDIEPTKKANQTTLSKIQSNKDLVQKNLKLTDFKYLSENLNAEFVSKIHQCFKNQYELTKDSIKQYAKQLKEILDDNVYFYHLMSYLYGLISNT